MLRSRKLWERLQDTELWDLLADEQGRVFSFCLRSSFRSIFQPPGLLTSREADKGVHEHRIKQRPEYSCAPNSWGTCKRREKSEIFSQQDFPTKQHFSFLRRQLVQSCTDTSCQAPSTVSWCKPRADGAVQWKIRSPRKYRVENKTPSSRKLHGLFRDKIKTRDLWAKIDYAFRELYSTAMSRRIPPRLRDQPSPHS